MKRVLETRGRHFGRASVLSRRNERERPHGSTSTKQSITQLHDEWSYCLHSDWSVGYYVNFYYISSHIKGDEFVDMPQMRIESSLGGDFNPNRGNCEFDSVISCSKSAHVCHGQTAKSMIAQTKEIARDAPGLFRNY